jgi:hypothetical protein
MGQRHVKRALEAVRKAWQGLYALRHSGIRTRRHALLRESHPFTVASAQYRPPPVRGDPPEQTSHCAMSRMGEGLGKVNRALEAACIGMGESCIAPGRHARLRALHPSTVVFASYRPPLLRGDSPEQTSHCAMSRMGEGLGKVNRALEAACIGMGE